MRQVAKKGLLTAVATGSVLASTAGYAYAAGSEAHGGAANSPGVGSGNSVQAPVDLPVNACGNTVNVVGLLNPAYGNSCGNTSGDTSGDSPSHAGSGSSAEGGTHGSPGVASGNSVQTPVNAPVDACGNSVNVVGVGNPAFGNDCGNHGAPSAQPPTTPPPGDDCGPQGPGNPPPPSQTPPGQVPPGQTPPGSTPPSTTGGDSGTGTDRSGTPAGAPVQQAGLTTVSSPAAPVASAAPAAHGQLASTGADGVELLASAGALSLLGGGVLYRRSRAAAR